MSFSGLAPGTAPRSSSTASFVPARNGKTRGFMSPLRRAPSVPHEDAMSNRSSYASTSSSSSTQSWTQSITSPRMRSKFGQKLLPAMPLSVRTERTRKRRPQPLSLEDEVQIVISEDDSLPGSPPTPSYVSSRRPSVALQEPRTPLSPVRFNSNDLLLPRPSYVRAKSPSGDSMTTISEAATTPRAASIPDRPDQVESCSVTPQSRKRDSTQRRLSALRGLVANLDFNQHWSISEPCLPEESFVWACSGHSADLSSSTPNFVASTPDLVNHVIVDRPKADRAGLAPAGPVELLSPVLSPISPKQSPLPEIPSPLPSIPEQMAQRPRSRSTGKLQGSKRPRKTGSSSDLLSRTKTPEPPRPSSRMRREVFEVASSGYSKCLEPASPLTVKAPTGTWRSTLSSEHVYHAVIRTYGPAEVKRQEVVWEMCETELSFIKSLRHVVRLFAVPLRTPSGDWIQGIPPRICELFDLLERILISHNRLVELQSDLRHDRETVDVSAFVDGFQHWLPELASHEAFLVRFEGVVQLVEENVRDASSFFGEFVRMQMKQEVMGSMSLGSMLLKPVQRLTKYPLFLRRLLDDTPYPHPCHAKVLDLLSRTESLIRNLQATKGREEDFEALKALETHLQGLPSGMKLAVRGRKLLGQGPVVRLAPQKDLSPGFSRSRGNSILSHSSRNSISSTMSSVYSSPWDNGTATTPSTARTSAFSVSSSSSSHCPPSRSSSLVQTSPKRVGMTRSPSSVSSLADSRPSTPSSMRGPKRKEEVLTMLIFNDLVLLATESSDKPGLFSGKKKEKTYRVLPEMEGGIGKVIEVKDWSGWQGHSSLFTVTSLPFSLGTLAVGPLTTSFTLPTTSVKSTRLANCAGLTSVQRFTQVLSQTVPLSEPRRVYERVDEEMLQSTDHLAS